MKKVKIFAVLKYPIWLVISYFSAQFIIIVINTIFQSLLTSNIYKSIISILFYVLFIFILLFIPHIFFKKKIPSRKELGLQGTPTWTDILLAIIGFIVYLIISALLTKIFEIFPFFDSSQEQEIMYDFLNGNFERILGFISLAIIPPIVEEIAFRGWLYYKLKNKFSGKKARIISILTVSIFFGIMHGQWNVGISVFSMSVIFCLIRELTGTVYGGILAHMIANTIAFYLLFILQI